MISKRYLLDMCEYADVPLMDSEKKLIGECTTNNGRMVNVGKFLEKSRACALPVTRD